MRDAPRREGLIVIGAGPAGRGVASRTANVMSVAIVDNDAAALECELPETVRKVHGDGSSLLVLREAGVETVHAVMAASNRDDVNVEASRLAVMSGVPEVFCRLTDGARAEEVRAIGARPVTAEMALVGALTARLPGVAVTTSEVGIGEGEILQVRVMPGSLVIGRPLREIATREYLVGAIYRDGELVVPHGDTTVHAGDQVLLVGNPETLRAIADYYRLGAARFPMQFGRSLVVWGGGEDEGVAKEARWLAEVSAIQSVFHVTPVGTTDGTPDWGQRLPLAAGEIGLEALRAVHPAAYVIPPPSRGLMAAPSWALSLLLDRARSPIVMARGTAPWRRILVPVTDTETALRGLELAVDVARVVDARITALHVSQPRFLAGSRGEERRDAVERQVEEIMRLYDLEFDIRLEEGNSIRQAADVASEHQLVVAARRPGQADTYFRPDVGLRIALAAPCSSLLHNVPAG